MLNVRKTGLCWIWLSLVVVILDQATKFSVLHQVPLWSFIKITPFFNLTLAHNTGAAFSFLAGMSGWQNLLFGGLAIAVSIIIVWLMYKLPRSKKLSAVSLALILGGALGNLTDRFLHGFVIDFLDFYWHTLHWPAFNLADSAIVIGCVLMMLCMLRSDL